MMPRRRRRCLRVYSFGEDGVAGFTEYGIHRLWSDKRANKVAHRGIVLIERGRSIGTFCASR